MLGINKFLNVVFVQVVSVCISDVSSNCSADTSGRPLEVTITYVIVNDGYKLVDISLIEKRFVTTTDNCSAYNFGDMICKYFSLVFSS